MSPTQTPPAAANAAGPDAQRQQLRHGLLAARAAMADRTTREPVLANRVARWLATMPLARLGFYWPIKGEPDISSAVLRWLGVDGGRRAALPVVDGDVLSFAPWVPGAPMQAGRYGIPVPATAERIAPQLLLVPCLGFDAQRYRLGYGAGYYDRTLARLKVKPVTVGVAFDCGRVNSIGPQPHDVRLDLVITETGVL